MSTFASSVRLGTEAENVFCGLLERAGLTAARNPEKSVRSKMIGWDVESAVGGTPFRAEVKFDKMAARTGNIAVEHHNTRSDTPSGIAATTADLWVFVLSGKDGTWVAATAALKTFVSETEPHKEIFGGGDNNAALKLYRKDVILPAVFRRVDELGPGCFVSTIRAALGGPSQGARAG